MRGFVIHCNEAIPWQPKRAAYFVQGFKALGVPVTVTASRTLTHEGVPVLLGTTYWHAIEQSGHEFILVDRCSFGDTDRFVSLVWNAHGRRGSHCVPEKTNGARWKKYGMPLEPWRRDGRRVVLCGQAETYAPGWPDLGDWYRHAAPNCSHFRPHPTRVGDGPGLPLARNFDDTRLAVTLNSSVGVAAVLAGIPTVTMDAGAMAWEVSTHTLEDEQAFPDRRPWCNWLAYTQHTDEEIRDGTALKQLMRRN